MTGSIARITIGIVAVLALLASPVRAQEELEVGGGGDNTAVVVNTHDGQSRFRISFKIVRTSSDVVDNGNAAVAFSSCEGCRSVAIAFQVVLVSSDPSVVTPINLAIAMNFECIDCESLASAYQWVLGTDGRVHFTPEGSRAVADIRRQLSDLLHSELPIEEIQAILDALAEDLERVLSDELATAGPPDVSADHVTEGDSSPPPQPGTTPDDDTTSTPGPEAQPTPATPTPENTASPTPESTASPTSSPSPAPTPTSSP